MTNASYDLLCRLAAERTIVHSPRGFSPREARTSPLILKSHPGLALSPHPPRETAQLEPSEVNGAASRGFSRSMAGLPWAESVASRPPPGICADGPTGAGVWSGRFKTEYSTRFATWTQASKVNARALNHQRLVFDAQSKEPQQPFSSQPFAALSQPVSVPFQESPRATPLGCSFRDNFSTTTSRW